VETRPRFPLVQYSYYEPVTFPFPFPISAMPPLDASLPPRDLRDLVAYLASLTSTGKAIDQASHGEKGK